MKLISLLSLLVICGATSACNTFEGVGEDLQAGGRAIEDASR